MIPLLPAWCGEPDPMPWKRIIVSTPYGWHATTGHEDMGYVLALLSGRRFLDTFYAALALVLLDMALKDRLTRRRAQHEARQRRLPMAA